MRLRLLATVTVFAMASLVFAVPFTGHFGDLDTEVAERQAALPTSGLSKDQKKERSALKKYVKAVGKMHKDLLKDVSTGSKVDRSLAKVYTDPEMTGLLDALLADIAGDVETRFEGLDARVDALVAAKPAKKATKARDQAEGFLGTAAAATDHKTAYKFYKKALVKVRVGEKQATKAENPGGGGGGGGGGVKCNGRAPTGGEFATMTIDGENLTADNLSVSVTRDMGNITQYTLTLTTCGGTQNHQFEVVIEGEPVVGFYSFGVIGGTRGYGFERLNSQGGFIMVGADIEITSYDAMSGVVEGTMTNAGGGGAGDRNVSFSFRSESGF